MPRTQRPWYVWPTPGRSAERTAANPGEPAAREGGSPRRARTACARLLPTPGFDIDRIGYETRRAIERPLSPDRATLRGARAVGIVCATLFFLPVIVSLALPSAFLYPPYHRIYERMLGALLLAFGLGLLLALRDPARNAGVFAVVGLATGFLCAANVYALVVDRADPLHWVVQVPLLAAITAGLVLTYMRLRRPHPVVVRIVVAAVVLLPFALLLYDLAYGALVH